ncbi:hypothetical protein HYQ44_003044 [Verticillium longisporum]|nr:hypothetical protein HYQ44_003044 [Verticillium longisporum]
MADHTNLTPPKRTGTADPGAKDLAESSDDDHFSDAQSAPETSPKSPIPKTRVEKVDDEPSYGEVPGTEAYRKREEDAEPDEIALVEDKKLEALDDGAPTTSPGGQPIPLTVVEESSGTTGEHSEEFLEKRKADADADVVVKPDGQTEESNSTDSPVPAADVSSPTTPAVEQADTSSPPPGSPDTVILDSHNAPAADSEYLVQATESTDAMPEQPALEVPPPKAEDDDDDDDENGDNDENDDGDDDADFGDDFDDFEEGGEDADFDDFEDGFQQAETQVSPEPAARAPPPAVPLATLPFPIPDLDDLDGGDISDALDNYLHSLFPPAELDLPTLPPLSRDNNVFLSQRSASLWSQLVAPPPVSPPDWIRSRIRRLFLVSLGVPVDLDEILPASKQKKLILPSLHRKTSNGSFRTSSESRSVSRVRQSEANASTTSLDSSGNAKRPTSMSQRKGPPLTPELDLVAGRQLATTTEEALNGMTDDELKTHNRKLEALENVAKEVLEHWTKKTDEKIGDREAFEAVIENLVKHAQKTRK